MSASSKKSEALASTPVPETQAVPETQKIAPLAPTPEDVRVLPQLKTKSELMAAYTEQCEALATAFAPIMGTSADAYHTALASLTATFSAQYAAAPE